MKPDAFEKSSVYILRAFRILRAVKQERLAEEALATSGSNYNKIEKCQRALKVGELRKITAYLSLNFEQILAFAEADAKIKFKEKSIKTILSQLSQISDGKIATIGFNEHEIYFIIKKIKEAYDKEKDEN